MMSLKRIVAIISSLVYAAVVVVVLPLLIYERNRHYSSKVEAWFIGGLFVLATLPFCMYGIIQHALNYSKPYLQKYIIRILFMVPIYALNSWIVLKFPQTSIYLDTIRECYEAFVIYNFMMYLISFLKYEVPNMQEIAVAKRNVRWICCCPPCANGISVLNKCKFGVLQYTLIRIITSLIAYISEIFNSYNEGEINFKFSWSYVAIANNFSQMIAMFSLVLFYTVFREELAPLKPIRQYLCIKFVVFATFWQSVLLAILVKFKIISPDHWPYFPTLIDTVNGLQDFLICIEMFIAAIAHVLAFPVTPYKIDHTDDRPRPYWISNIANAANVSDFNSEVKEHLSHFQTRVKGMFRRKSGSNGATTSSSSAAAFSDTGNDGKDTNNMMIANEHEDADERTNLLSSAGGSSSALGTGSDYGYCDTINGPLLTIESESNEDAIEI